MPPVRVEGVNFEVLDRKWLLLMQLALAGCIALTTFGCAGLYVLTDLERESWLANTPFAFFYWQLAQRFPYLTAAFVNGGMLGMLFSGLKLYGHRKMRLEQQQQVSQRRQPEAKKTR